MALQDTLETLIRFKLNVPELKADFQAVAREVEKLNSVAITAGRGVGESIANAREIIGVRAFTDIRKEISQVISAFDTLKNTGKLSGRELEATFNAAAEKVAALKKELTKNITPNVSAFDATGKARDILGIRNGAEIRAEIDKIKGAFRGLRDSGTLSGQELQTAFSAARKRLRELRDEAKGVQFLSTRAGAPPQGPPGANASGSSGASPSFLSQVTAASLGNLTGAFTAAQLAANALTRSIEEFFKALAAGVVFLRDTEQRVFGIAGILTSLTEITNIAPSFNQSLNASAAVVQRLNDAALVTAASSKDLIAGFQGIVGPGLAAKLTLEQIIQLTITGVNAVKSLGLNQTQVVQEIRDLVQGGIQPASSTLATALGIRDSDVARLRGNGEEFFKFLNDRLKGFGVASQRFGDTFSGAFEQVKDVFTRLNAQATLPVFEALRKTFVDIVAALVDINRQTGQVAFRPEVVTIVERIADGLNAVIVAIRNVLSSFSELGGAFDVFAESMTLFTRLFLGAIDVIRVGIGGILVVVGTIVKVLGAIGNGIAAIREKVGQDGTELREVSRVYGETAEKVLQIGAGFVVGETSLSAFNRALEEGSKKAKQATADLAAFTPNVQSIIADGARIAQGLKIDVNKTAEEAQKLVLVLEQLRGKKVNDAQRTAVLEQLTITRQALNRSAKDFVDAYAPAIRFVAENAKQFTDALTSNINARAGVRGLALDFAKVRVELGGAASALRDISQIESTSAIGALGDAAGTLDAKLRALEERASSTKSTLRGTFDEATRQLAQQTQRELTRQGANDTSGVIGLQSAEAARQLAESQTRQIAQVDRDSAAERRQIYEQYFNTVQSLASQALQKYREYAQRVIELDKQIKNNRLDLQSSEFDIERTNRDPARQLASVRQELIALRTQTAQAIAANDDQLVSSLVSRRRQLARELLSLGGEGERSNALRENRQAAEEQIGLLERQRKAAAEARDNQLNTFLSLQAVLADVRDKIEQINATAVNISVVLDQASLQTVLDQVRSAISNIVATVRVQAVIDTATAGVAGFATGGLVRGPGTSTSDSILARLSNSEWVMRAAAVSYWGRDFMSDINAMRMPRFAGGGSPGGSGTRDTMDLNFHVGGSSFRLSGQREQVRDLVDALSNVSRGLH